MNKFLGFVTFLALSVAALGQGAKQFGTALSPRGVPLQGQNVAVCTQPANVSTTPCSSLATLGTSLTVTAGGSNPTTTDQLGNFNFYGTAGICYTVQIYGPQVSSPLVQTDVCPASGGNVVLGGNNTFTGSNTFKSIENVVFVSTNNPEGWAGVDACAWINSAAASLPATYGGIVDARGLVGNTPCAGGLTLGSNTKPILLLLGPVLLGIQGQVTVFTGGGIVGMSAWASIIQAQGAFPASTVMLQWNAGAISDGIHIRDVRIDCHTICNTAIDTGQTQDTSDIRNVLVYNYNTLGINIGTNSQQIMIDSVTAQAASTASNATGIAIGSTSNHVHMNNIGVGSQSAGQQVNGVLCTSCDMEIVGGHFENAVSAVHLAGAGSGTVSIHGINGLNNITSLVTIDSIWTGSMHATGLRKNLATHAVNNAIAAFNSFCDDETVAKYVLSSSTSSPQSLDTTCSALKTVYTNPIQIGTTPALTGQVELPSLGPGICFRNFANSADLCMTHSNNSSNWLDASAFPLTFWTSLGSNSANAATAGFMTLASSDVIAWRNNANTANINLQKTGAASGAIPADSLDVSGFSLLKTAYHKSANQTLQVITANFTTTSTTLAAAGVITGLNFTAPANVASNWSFECNLVYSQATAAAADLFGITTAGTAPTNLLAAGEIWTSLAGANTDGTAVISSATSTTVVTATPSGFGAIGTTAAMFTAHLRGTVEAPSNASPTQVGIAVATGNASDALTVYRGSACYWY